MTLILHARPGGKPSMIVRQRIPILLEELGLATPERIRQRYRVRFREPVAWNTVARHLQALVDSGHAIEHVVNAGKTRNTVLYELRR